MKRVDVTLFILLLLVMHTGCSCTLPSRSTPRPVTIRVLDAETRQPVVDAQISVHYFPSSPEQPNATFPAAITDHTGTATISVRPGLASWQIAASGYVTQKQSADEGTLPPRYRRAATAAVDGTVYLYTRPVPTLIILTSAGYTGPVVIDLQPAVGFEFAAPDGINTEFLPTSPDVSYVQEPAGRRSFTVTIAADGTAQQVVTPLLYDLSTAQVTIKESSRDLASGALSYKTLTDGDLNTADPTRRYSWGSVNEDDKRLSRQIRLFVGTQAEFLANQRNQ